MNDVLTRGEVSEVLKQGCVLKTVLVKGKDCPYFGPSLSCRDCVYSWELLGGSVRKIVDNRRACYEIEREKVKQLKILLGESEDKNEKLEDILKPIAEGFESVLNAVEYFKKE